MKMRELQQQLGKLDPDLDVLCYCEDITLQSDGQVFRLMEIETVSTMQGERVRLDNGTPYLKLGNSPTSVVFAVLEVTSDF